MKLSLHRPSVELLSPPHILPHPEEVPLLETTTVDDDIEYAHRDQHQHHEPYSLHGRHRRQLGLRKQVDLDFMFALREFEFEGVELVR